MKTFERPPARETATIPLARLEEQLALARTTKTVGEYRLALWERVQEFEHEPIVTKPVAEGGEDAAPEAYTPIEREALRAILEQEEKGLREMTEGTTEGIEEETRGKIGKIIEEPTEAEGPVE